MFSVMGGFHAVHAFSETGNAIGKVPTCVDVSLQRRNKLTFRLRH